MYVYVCVAAAAHACMRQVRIAADGKQQLWLTHTHALGFYQPLLASRTRARVCTCQQRFTGLQACVQLLQQRAGRGGGTTTYE